MTDSRLAALRALLAKHTPTPDDARGGHTYRYPRPDARVRMGDARHQLGRRVARFLTRFDRRSA